MVQVHLGPLPHVRRWQEEHRSKKLLMAAVAAIGGALALRKMAADRNAKQDLWAEATNRVR